MISAQIQPTLPPGTPIGGFQIVRHIANGGMGSVYEVRNRITGEPRALKIMLPQYANQQEFVTRFVREIRMMMTVAHPNIVRVYEPGMEGSVVFLPMELLLGETLSERLKREGRVPVMEAVQLLLTIGLAVITLHDHGILHRDLKPSNVFLARMPDGVVVPKVLDLGAARTVVDEEATAAGTTIGSPHYMAFEQASGRRDIDARVDQYALGVILYQMLTGFRPYESDDTSHAIAKVLAGFPYRKPRELNPEIPPKLEQAVLRAMSRDRDQRFPTLREFLSAVAASCGFQLLEPPRTDSSGTAKVTSVVSVGGPPKSRVVEIAVVGALALMVLAVVLVLVMRIQRTPAPASDEGALHVTATLPVPQPPVPSAPVSIAPAPATTPPVELELPAEPTPTAPSASASAAPPAVSVTATATNTVKKPPKCVPKPGVPCL